MEKKIIYAIILTAVIAGGGVGITYWALTQPSTDRLEIYHWWTSGGEAAAYDALVKVYQSQYPATYVKNVSVPGGAGYAFLTVIKALALAGALPDAFQMHAGYEGHPYIEADMLTQLDDLWTAQGLGAVIPAVVGDMCKYNGHYYSVPVNIHRTNVVWYSKKVIADSGIDINNVTTWDGFFDACKKAKDIGGITYPIGLGESWTAAHAFEQIVASEGIAFYEEWVNGHVNETSGTNYNTLVAALNTYATYLSYTQGSNTNSWDTETKKLIANTSAFNIMGDWANGEFLKAGQTFLVEYNVTQVPGTNNMYGLCIDTFQTPKEAPHSTNSRHWLEVVSSKAGQDAFNPLKGSISARTDADLTKYGPYQQDATSDFKTATYMFPSVVHGSGAPEGFKVELQNIISQFVSDLNVGTAATAIANLANTVTWTTVWDITP